MSSFKAAKDGVLFFFLFHFLDSIMIEILISRQLYVSNIIIGPTVLVLTPFSLQKEKQITGIGEGCVGRLFNCVSVPLLPSSLQVKYEMNNFAPNNG